MHYITLLAVSVPLLVSLLCVSVGISDGLTHSLFIAAAASFSGFIMWVRSRCLATLYLSERQARQWHFTDALRRQFSGGADAAVREAAAPRAGGGATDADAKQVSPVSQPPRTVARLSPVLPAFMACCFFLLSVLFTISAALHAIWYVRSLEAEQP
ncbi:hypothetical protein, conserved [Leishmania lindenbergi]|uniref:Uncharacterized protein n=1 Tax=Leishmania lindenbergi TaxID=651832 RepID=A0AAW3AT65_9TRYP